MYFREWKVLYFTEDCSQGSISQLPYTGLDDGLVMNRWQAIIWTNADSVHWRIYAALGGEKLNV